MEKTINNFITPLRETSGRNKNRVSLLIRKIPQNRLYKIKPDDIKSSTRMYSPLMQTYLAYLVANDAKSWPSARDIREIASRDVTGDMLAVHHIFPKEFMNQFDIPLEKLNTAANYSILSQADNAELSDRDPREAHTELSPAQRDMALVQLLFRDSERLDYKAYEETLEYRARQMAEKLNDFLALGRIR